MTTQTRDDLNKAHRAAEDKGVSRRILAVHCVLDKKMTHGEDADMVFSSAPSVGNWAEWHAEGKPDALRDLPRSGRPAWWSRISSAGSSVRCHGRT